MSELSLLSDLRVLSKTIYWFANRFPYTEKYNLTSQVKRAIISSCLNVREGNVFRDKRKISHFERALGSLVEVDECMILSINLGYILEDDDYQIYRDQYFLCLNKLKKLINSINSGE